MKFGSLIQSPNFIFNNRNINGVSWLQDNEQLAVVQRHLDVRKLMMQIARERKIENTSLLANIMNRNETFSIGQRVLVWQQWVIKRQVSGVGQGFKLENFWMYAEVIDKVGPNYWVKTEEGALLRVNQRQMKKAPEKVPP